MSSSSTARAVLRDPATEKDRETAISRCLKMAERQEHLPSGLSIQELDPRSRHGRKRSDCHNCPLASTCESWHTHTCPSPTYTTQKRVLIYFMYVCLCLIVRVCTTHMQEAERGQSGSPGPGTQTRVTPNTMSCLSVSLMVFL